MSTKTEMKSVCVSAHTLPKLCQKNVGGVSKENKINFLEHLFKVSSIGVKNADTLKTMSVSVS